MQQLFEGEALRPGNAGDEATAPQTRRHRLGCQVLSVDGLDRVAASPIHTQAEFARFPNVTLRLP